jgi:hypothetical protein
MSHPSVSIDTETTQRICSPSRPTRPTVFITSRSKALSLVSPCAPAALSRAASSRLNCSISGPAASRNPLSSASPDSIWRESISSVRGRARRPSDLKSEAQRRNRCCYWPHLPTSSRGEYKASARLAEGEELESTCLHLAHKRIAPRALTGDLAPIYNTSLLDSLMYL